MYVIICCIVYAIEDWKPIGKEIRISSVDKCSQISPPPRKNPMSRDDVKRFPLLSIFLDFILSVRNTRRYKYRPPSRYTITEQNDAFETQRYTSYALAPTTTIEILAESGAAACYEDEVSYLYTHTYTYLVPTLECGAEATF